MSGASDSGSGDIAAFVDGVRSGDRAVMGRAITLIESLNVHDQRDAQELLRRLLPHTGNAKPFSADADGTVLGEGIGLVVLKRLDDAQRDGDRIYAVIRGIGSSSDGKSQSIYAPLPGGQSKALRRAYAEAGIDPTTVSLVEAHGTGTRVGDQVEFNSLCDVFGKTSPNGNRCALGSVKSNIGHTKAAAGTAGLIKAALSIYNKILPPTLKAETADPKLGVEHSPFYLNTKLRPWI